MRPPACPQQDPPASDKSGEAPTLGISTYGYARGEAQLSTDLGGLDPSADTHDNYGDILRTVVNAETHPMLTELVASGIFDGPTEYDEEIDFGFGLTTILDGVEKLISSPPA